MNKTRFHSELEARITKAVENRSASIASGGCTDYPQYQQNVGYVLGLLDALKICSEIEEDSQ